MDDIQPRLRQLAADLDRLEAAAAPLLLGDNMAASSRRLPLLDKAKLHVLSAFALETSLYCGLGLAGADARGHPVFRELQRVRQYMDKIKTAENPPQAPTSKLDKSAAIRFVKADVDDPAMKAQLGALLREEQAAAAAAAAAGGDASPGSSSPTHNNYNSGLRGRKRGGSNTAGSPLADRGNLTKRPKHGSSPAGDKKSSSSSSRSHPYNWGSRAT